MKKRCPCCHGLGVQYNRIKGIRVICPACNGTGEREVEDERWRIR